LILNCYESHYSTEFELYYRDNKIITLYIPIYSSYKCQLLDIGYFGLLKQVYSRLIEELIHIYINYITKLEFLYTFRKAFFTSITERNIQGSFIRASIILFDPERVLSKLDIKLYIPIPPNSRPSTI
jgi:hypothetical protein